MTEKEKLRTIARLSMWVKNRCQLLTEIGWIMKKLGRRATLSMGRITKSIWSCCGREYQNRRSGAKEAVEYLGFEVRGVVRAVGMNWGVIIPEQVL